MVSLNDRARRGVVADWRRERLDGWAIVYGYEGEEPCVEWRAFAATRPGAFKALAVAWGAQNVVHWRSVMVVRAVRVSILLNRSGLSREG